MGGRQGEGTEGGGKEAREEMEKGREAIKGMDGGKGASSRRRRREGMQCT